MIKRVNIFCNMFWTNLQRIVRSGFINFWRNRATASASVLVMTVTLFVIGALLLGSAFLQGSLQQIKDRVDISVLFKPDAPESEVLSLQSAVESLPQVKEAKYNSRDRELQDFIERHKDNTLLIQSLSEVGNPFGARLNIRAQDPSMYETISQFLTNKDDVALGGKGIIDQISLKKDVIDKLNKIIATTNQVGFAVSLVLVILSVLVALNTISLTIYTAREEISVMQLVGARRNYVRGPFVVEGIMAGMLATVLAIIVLYPAVLWVRATTVSVYGGIDLLSYYLNNFGQILFILLLSGVGIGALSSYLAIRKYLKV